MSHFQVVGLFGILGPVFAIAITYAGWKKNPFAAVLGMSLWILGWLVYWKIGNDFIATFVSSVGVAVWILASIFQLPKLPFGCRTS